MADTYRMRLKCTECFFIGWYNYTKGNHTDDIEQTCLECGQKGSTLTPDPLFEKIDFYTFYTNSINAGEYDENKGEDKYLVEDRLFIKEGE